MTQRMQAKEESIKNLRSQLEHLTKELNRTTEYIQLLEIQDETKTKQGYMHLEPEHEISELLQKQNTISHEIILVKKRIQKLSAKTILKIELLILPVVIVLLFFVATNYAIQPADTGSSIKTRYLIENLRGSITDDYKYWNIIHSTPLVVNIENDVSASNQNVQAVKNAIMSTETITGDKSQSYNTNSETITYFKGWQGAIQSATDTKHYIPEKFTIIQSPNGEGQIVITLSTIKDGDGYSGITRIIVDGNQILKAFITIYGADRLTDVQIESIVRHEFGHALGLSHTSNPLDLMHDSIATDHSYISSCDINALQKLYNNVKPSDDFCSS